MRTDRQRLVDILRAIDRIESHAKGNRAAFHQDETLQALVAYQLVIIGEASSRLSDEVRAQAPEVPWRDITGMRNWLVHVYFNVELELVWSVVEERLDPLRRQVLALLELTGGADGSPG